MKNNKDARKVYRSHEVIDRSSRPEVFCKKVFLEISQNSQENTCARVSFLKRNKSPSTQHNNTKNQIFRN